MQNDDVFGIPPIEALFYSVFHPTEGTKVLCEIPDGSITRKPGMEPLFEFDWVKNYVIPKPALCNRLVTFKIDKYRVVGYPVHIFNSSYERNSFDFNIAFVFDYDEPAFVYEMAIRRLARMFRALEMQSRFMSKAALNLSAITNIMEQIFMDLNNYSECMIPIDDSNTVNMKLFPLFPPPPKLESHYVPISMVNLSSYVDDNWDPTLEKIYPHINGKNSIRQIADWADADYDLTLQCMEHLLHYRLLIITDLFQFSNFYAPTNLILQFISDDLLYEECKAYVFHPATRVSKPRTSSGLPGSQSGAPAANFMSQSFRSSASSHSFSVSQTIHSRPVAYPSKATLFKLYTTLHQGVSVRDWYIMHEHVLRNIDVRRFISFGVIKRLIYRVHSYPFYDGPHSRALSSPKSRRESFNHSAKDAPPKEIEKLISKLIMSPLHFDAICTDLRLTQKDVTLFLEEKGCWTVVNS